MTTNDNEFFNKYAEFHDEIKGIPGVEMNAPLVHNTFVGDIGIELELEPAFRTALPRDGHLELYQTPKSGARWMSIEDGSLRNGGREYIVNSPILVDEVDAAIDALWDVFELTNVRLENSNRCSTHVHINMKGKLINQLTSIIVLWGTFEELIINWCGEERKTNHFCLSVKDAANIVATWDRYLSTGSTAGFTRELKYSALNILPIWDRGSLEFRCGPAADNKEIAKNWVKFVHSFVEYATTAYPNPEQIGHDLSERGGHRIINDICRDSPDFRQQLLFNVEAHQVDEMALNGFRNVQKLALGHPWGEWLPLITRAYVPNPFLEKKIKIRNTGEMPRRINPLDGVEFVDLHRAVVNRGREF